ncbi:Mitogen-activated protein kinase kinase 3 [Labeo rohita]|uniref:Mitogen-activated protein kinase kinase 3 n=1 Tax=Labeo rohita TaxID=84645 RepID=A0ABQ8L7H5_LABRO|nr:Mitogen-activated protein kinase kinase 3 [Labeo rohita]
MASLFVHGLKKTNNQYTCSLPGATSTTTEIHASMADHEATDGNMDRILNVVVRYYDEDVGKVATQHLASRKLNIADPLTITKTLTDILQSYSLNWNQVVGILLDNCSVMRGKKSGVETLVRRENPSLLDVSGDTVHMVSNAAKALLNPFQGFVEQFCSDVYYDIEKSPKQKEVFSEFQSLLHLENKSLIRPISSRFLQMLDVCNRIRELMDPLTVHFYSVLSSHDQHKHRRFCLSSYETYQNHLKKKKVNLDKQKERKLREAVKVLSAVRVRKVKKGSTSSVCAKAPTSSTLGVKQKAAATASTPAVKGAAATVSTSSTAGVKGKAAATASFSSTPGVKGKTAATASTPSTSPGATLAHVPSQTLKRVSGVAKLQEYGFTAKKQKK